ncbi:MAG TPA: ABC transporter ATP-binding protein [Candidatus Limnocylindrales bacterium]|nr:ABC transporter ATP-binding protein [Candidatus Limnocylindrales bacterium]
MDPSAPAVELRDVRLAYRGREALRGVDLVIGRGERVAVLGPNGAGKSSLLRCLTGIAEGCRGSVRLGGVPVEQLGRGGVARRVAVVPQLAALPFAMGVREVVALGRIPHEDPLRGLRPADRAAVEAAIGRVGIGALAERDARELSLGERQLVLVAMAVAQQAPLLVLDEPTVHLDLRHRVGVMELLAELNQGDGVTVVAVLHDLALARAFFPRLVLLADGRVVADGPPDEVLAAERVEAVFGVDRALAALVGAA